MEIEKIAKEMANSYKENELKWILVLKRLEKKGYKVEKRKELKIGVTLILLVILVLAIWILYTM